MPVRVEFRGGKRPWKIVEASTGVVKASSVTKKDAEASARARNAATKGK
ncbi:hypothetical protein LCGC14_2655820 [marine sediment metagenome]|uniref:DUF1508 domain-containing protein n=1 Tax=marine sediment metagenome TaxID=412755 RepID=A0A0F9C3T8_9ZZZZ